jgi:hypothetical protein
LSELISIASPPAADLVALCLLQIPPSPPHTHIQTPALPPSHRYNFSGTLSLRFEADYSGLIHFTSADCTVESEVMEEKIVEVPVNGTEGEGEDAAEGAKKGSDKNGGKKGSKWGWKGKGKGDKKQAEAVEDKGQEGAGEEGEGGNATAAAANKTATVVKTILVPKRKTFQVGAVGC